MNKEHYQEQVKDFYCPSCGEWSYIECHILLAPGEQKVKCPRCDTLFKINIEFIEIERNI